MACVLITTSKRFREYLILTAQQREEELGEGDKKPLPQRLGLVEQ